MGDVRFSPKNWWFFQFQSRPRMVLESAVVRDPSAAPGISGVPAIKAGLVAQMYFTMLNHRRRWAMGRSIGESDLRNLAIIGVGGTI